MARAQQGSLPSFAELLRRFEPRVFNFILRRIGGQPRFAEGEDLTQETFMRAWQSLHRYQPTYRFSTWLFTIATRIAIDHLRARRSVMTMGGMNRGGAHVGDLTDEVLADRERGVPIRRTDWRVGVFDPLHRLIAEEERAPLWELAGRLLSDEQHSALWLRYAEDLPIADVARALGRTRVSARVLLFRARQLLARHATLDGKISVDAKIAGGTS